MTFVPYLVDAHLHTFFRVLRPGGLDLLMSERVQSNTILQAPINLSRWRLPSAPSFAG